MSENDPTQAGAAGDPSASFLRRRLDEQEAAVLSETPPFPRNLMLELSNACNHACSFCYNARMRRRRGLADSALVRRVLAEAHELGAREVGFATTGEALVHKRLLDHVAAAKQIGYDYTYFSTNGGLLTPELVDRIPDSGLDSIKFSINAGTAANYATVHGRDEFDHVVAMVRLLDRRRRATDRPLKLLVTSILTPENASEGPRLEEALGDAVDEIAFFPATGAVGPTNGSLAPLPCPMVFNRAHVSWEGYLTACCVDYEGHLVTADLNTTPLAEAWRNEAFRALRRRHMDEKLEGTLCHVCVTREEIPYAPLTTIGRESSRDAAPVTIPPETTRTASTTATDAGTNGAASITPRYASASHVLVLFTGSMGEVDWLLPVLTRMREKAPEVKILALIGDAHLQAELQRSDFFRKRLDAVADVYHHGRDHLSSRYCPKEIGLVLKTDDPEDAVAEAYRRRLPHAPVATFPSGTAILTLEDDTPDHVDAYFTALAQSLGQDVRAGYRPVDLCLVTSPHVVPYYRHVLPDAELRVVGSPRYDDWWVREMREDPGLAGSIEAEFVRRHTSTLLAVVRGPHWLYLDEADHDALLTGLVDAVRRHRDFGAIIKPHPRQDPRQLAVWLRGLGAEGFMISHRPLLQLAHLADLTVNMFSSGVLDSLRVRTPAVEYYRYHDRQPVLEFRRDREGASEGRMVSIYERLGLVENVETAEGLAHALERFTVGDDEASAALPERRQRAREVAGWGNDRAGETATLLLDLLRKGRVTGEAEREAIRQDVLTAHNDSISEDESIIEDEPIPAGETIAAGTTPDVARSAIPAAITDAGPEGDTVHA